MQLFNSINFLALCIVSDRLQNSQNMSFSDFVIPAKSSSLQIMTGMYEIHLLYDFMCSAPVFFQDQKTCLEKENSEKKTPLHMASENGHVE